MELSILEFSIFFIDIGIIGLENVWQSCYYSFHSQELLKQYSFHLNWRENMILRIHQWKN